MLLFLALLSPPQMPDVNRDFILTSKLAYIMLAPDVVCGPTVTDMEWSPDGRMLAVRRKTDGLTKEVVTLGLAGQKAPEVKRFTEIYLWNAQTRTTKLAFSGDASICQLGPMQWTGGTAALVMTATVQTEDTPRVEIWFIKSNGITKTLLPDYGQAYSFGPSVSSTHDIGAMVWNKRGSPTSTLRFFNSAGRFGPELSTQPSTQLIEWSGEAALIGDVKLDGNGAPKRQWAEIDKRNGALVPTKLSPSPHLNVSSDLQITAAPIEVKVGSSQAVRVRALATSSEAVKGVETQSALLTADGGQAAISAGNTAVAFTVQGVAMVRPLVAIPRDAFLQVREASARSQILSRAKQVVTAMIMYGADNNNQWPANANWQDAADSYLKNRSLFEGFNYTFAGGALPAGSDPSKFSIGFASGPGGRAVVYADGSVRWEKNP
jgi:hypothetical protein